MCYVWLSVLGHPTIFLHAGNDNLTKKYILKYSPIFYIYKFEISGLIAQEVSPLMTEPLNTAITVIRSRT